VIEQTVSRDHTENMLLGFGAHVEREWLSTGGQRITVAPGQSLQACRVQVPGDFSAAAFHVAAALVVPGSTVTLQNVGLNPTRTGFLNVVERMGAHLSITGQRLSAGEALGNLIVHSEALQGVDIHSEEVPALIDELPVIAVLAAYAHGTTHVHGASELRFKETDRITAMVSGLQNIGVDAEETADGFIVRGRGDGIPGGQVSSRGDHRVAMSLAIAGMGSQRGVEVEEWGCVEISYPRFLTDIRQLGYIGL
jgi:3-phosphoshikimate 1-carboxyvinyltransferase